MANLQFYQFFWSRVPQITFLEGDFTIGATGAVGTVKGTAFPITTSTATTTASSTTMALTSSQYISVGQHVNGPGINAGTTISALAGLTATLSANATATGTGSYNFSTGIKRTAVGTYQVNLIQPFNRYLGGGFGIVSPTTGSNILTTTSLTTGQVYVITGLGTTTLAGWQAVGLPVGITPAVGVAFPGITGGGGNGTGTVKAAGVSGITSVEIVGDPQLTVNNNTQPYIMIQCLGPTDATHTTPIPTDPTSGSVVKLSFYFRNSSLPGPGE